MSEALGSFVLTLGLAAQRLDLLACIAQFLDLSLVRPAKRAIVALDLVQVGEDRIVRLPADRMFLLECDAMRSSHVRTRWGGCFRR